MLEFVDSRAMPMLVYLERYVENPWWDDQAIDILPLVAASPHQTWPLWTEEALHEEGMRKHLFRALKRWSAFRGGTKKHNEIKAALTEYIPSFMADLQAMPQARLHLSDVPADEIKKLAEAIEARMQRFAQETKGSDSCVLPSKMGQLLLPCFLPACDQEIAMNWTLRKVIAKGRRMSHYLIICWWVLQQFTIQGTLQQARNHVAEFLLSDWVFRVLLPQNLSSEHWLLRSLDSLVAEYTLFQMAETVENGYSLRWL